MLFGRNALLALPALMISICVNAQGAAWAQCGGQTWTGVTTCVAGYSCVALNTYYSQCQPVSTSVGTTASVTTTPTSTTSSNPTTTSSSAAVTGSQIRTVQAPVYHFYLQNHGGVPALGPESSSAKFTIGGTISLNNADGSKLYLNLNSTVTTSYIPLTFGSTATTTNWGLEGDTIITTSPRQLNFIACSTSSSDFFDLFLQNGNDTPSGRSCTLQTIHLPCLC